MRIRFLVVAAAVLAVAAGLFVVGPLTRSGGRPDTTRPVPAAADAGVPAVDPAPSQQPKAVADGHSAAARPTPAQLDAAMCAANDGAKLIRVSISRQRAWLCDGTALALATPVTTGADVPDRRTHPGTWQIQGKQTDRWLGGPGYSVRVDWWMPYDGDFGLHDADWQTMPFGSPQWRTQGSHGCVHLPHAAMQQLYAWAPVGTTITIEA